MTSPEPAVVTALATDGSTILLGTNESDAGELFRSTDGGLSWKNAGLPNGGVGDILFDEESGSWLVGTYLGGIYRSSDGGVQWSAVTPGLTVDAIIRHESSLFSGEALFSPQPIYRSDDDGLTWDPIPGSPNVKVVSLLSDGANIYVGTDRAGIRRSTDDGLTWETLPGVPSSASVRSLCLHEGAVYAGVSDVNPFGVFRSTDAGDSWVQTPSSPTTSPAHMIRTLLSHDGAIYAGLSGLHSEGVFRTTDAGATWNTIDASLPGEHKVHDFFVDPNVGNALFVALGDGLYRTEDDGQSWIDSDLGVSAIRGIDCMLDHGGSLHVGLQTSGTLGRGVWKTTDLGTTWIGSTDFGPGTNAESFLSRGSEILAGIYSPFPRGLFRSSDNGDTWSSSSNGISTSTIIRDIHDDGSNLWIAAYEALYRSTDDGVNWTEINALTDIHTIEEHGERLVIGTRELGAHYTLDGGTTWNALSNGLPDAIVEELHDMNGVLFASIWGHGIYRLEGDTWIATSHDNGFQNVLTSVGSTLITQDILDRSFYVSIDHGDTWVSFDDGYFGGEVYALTTWNGYLVAGARGLGIWYRPVTDLPDATEVEESELDLRPRLALRAHPNPFAEQATLEFELPNAGLARLALYDVSGREIVELDAGWLRAGEHSVTLSAAQLNALPAGTGSFFAVLTVNGERETTRLIRVR